MRENRTHGSEGGESREALLYPYRHPTLVFCFSARYRVTHPTIYPSYGLDCIRSPVERHVRHIHKDDNNSIASGEFDQ